MKKENEEFFFHPAPIHPPLPPPQSPFSVIACSIQQLLYCGKKGANLKYRKVIFPVDFIGWWVEPATFLCVSLENVFASHVLQTELTQIKLL